MRSKLPVSLVAQEHQDFELLSLLSREILKRAGGLAKLEGTLGTLLRDCIDRVIQTPKTGRRSYAELEKTERTHIGTLVEIELRHFLRLPKGRKLDLLICEHEVDIKHTMGNNWMIPREAIDMPCVLVAADEKNALCYLGLIVARPAYLTQSQNQDKKRSISADGFQHIHWLIRGEPYPPNFWRKIPLAAVERIFAGRSGNDRLVSLFREVQKVPVPRTVIDDVGRQKDFMRRARADKGRGTRNRLAAENIILLSGEYHSGLAKELGLPPLNKSEFMSYTLRSATERALARAAKLIDV